MKKKNLFILGAEITILLGGIFLVFVLLKPNTPTEKGIITEIKESIQEKWTNIQTTHARDTESYNRAIQYANEKACNTISDENKKTECADYALIAKMLKNPESGDCSIIANENRKTECINLTFEKTAIDTKNKNICKNIADNDIAQRCRESVDAGILAEISKNNDASVEKCEKLEASFQVECNKMIANHEIELRYSEAVKSQEIGLCGIIGDEYLMQKCRNTIIANKALSEGNVLLCDYISDASEKKSCLEKTKLQKDSKLFETATNSDNLAMCENISQENIKHRCNDIIILSIVKKTKNTNLCQNLKNSENGAICQKLLNS